MFENKNISVKIVILLQNGCIIHKINLYVIHSAFVYVDWENAIKFEWVMILLVFKIILFIVWIID